MTVPVSGTLIGRTGVSRTAPAAWRFGLSALGPICVSAAHFTSALMLLRVFGRAEFGLFSFALVIVPFCQSLIGAMIGVPVGIDSRRGEMGADLLFTYLKASAVLASFSFVGVFVLLKASGATFTLAILFAAYGGAMTLRWFARTLCYATASPARVPVSDIVYGSVLISGFLLLFGLHALTPARAAALLAAAAITGLATFGRMYLRQQFVSLFKGSLAGYARIWREFARWSSLGVVLTEFTANAHAWLVTFIAGPAAFAPLAIGALLMRPVQLVLAAVPDLERPLMARRMASGDFVGTKKSVNQFRIAAGAVWLLTLTSSAALLMWYPQLILKAAYDPAQAGVVLAFFAAITLARTLRAADSVLLQAAAEFRALAGVSFRACTASLGLTLLLLIVAGPTWSLAGILAGELVMMHGIRARSRAWMRAHA